MTDGPDQQLSRAASSPARDRPPAAATPGMPRWVKTLMVLAVALVAVLVVVGLLTGGHGPGRHLGSGPVSTSSATYPAALGNQAATTHS